MIYNVSNGLENEVSISHPPRLTLSCILNPIKTRRFTILKGNGKSILGIKNDGTAPDDSLYDELEEYFKLAPSDLERCYSFVNDKVVTDLKGDIGPPI